MTNNKTRRRSIWKSLYKNDLKDDKQYAAKIITNNGITSGHNQMMFLR